MSSLDLKLDPWEEARSKLHGRDFATYVYQQYIGAIDEFNQLGRPMPISWHVLDRRGLRISKFRWLLADIVNTCLCCGSHNITGGYIEISPQKIKWDDVRDGIDYVVNGTGVNYERCRDCKRVLYCDEIKD